MVTIKKNIKEINREFFTDNQASSEFYSRKLDYFEFYLHKIFDHDIDYELIAETDVNDELIRDDNRIIVHYSDTANKTQSDLYQERNEYRDPDETDEEDNYFKPVKRGEISSDYSDNYTKKYSIDLLGTDQFGNNICVHVLGYKPYFHIIVPNGCKYSDIENELRYFFIERATKWKHHGIAPDLSRHRAPLYNRGFENGKMYRFIRLTFDNIITCRTFYNHFTKTEKIIETRIQVCDDNIGFAQYLIMKSLGTDNKCITTGTFLKTKRWKNVPIDKRLTYCGIEIYVHCDDITYSCSIVEKRPKILNCYFDIETTNIFSKQEHSDLINYTDPIGMICAHFGYLDEKNVRVRCGFMLGKPDITKIKTDMYLKTYKLDHSNPDAIESRELYGLIDGFYSTIFRVMPENIVSFNGQGFDFKYIYKRLMRMSQEFDDAEDLVNMYSMLSCYKHYCCPMIRRQSKSKQKTNRRNIINIDDELFDKVSNKKIDNMLYYPNIPNTVNIDLYIYYNYEKNETPCSLNAITSKYLRKEEMKIDISKEVLYGGFKNNDESMLAETLNYCVRDAEALHALTKVSMVIEQKIAVSNITLCPIDDIFNKGTSRWVGSLLNKKTIENCFIIPKMTKNEKKKIKERKLLNNDEIDEVIKSYIKKVNKDVDALDENEMIDLTKILNAKENKKAKENKYTGGVCGQESLYDDDDGEPPILPYNEEYSYTTILDYSSMYPTIIISYNIGPESCVHNEKYENIPGVTYKEVEYSYRNGTRVRKKFVQAVGNHKPTVLSQCVTITLDSRNKVKKQLKETNGRLKSLLIELEKEIGCELKFDNSSYIYIPVNNEIVITDKQKERIKELSELKSLSISYDVFQNGFKIVGNAFYGCCGADFMNTYNESVAAAITAIGRDTIKSTMRFVHKKFNNCKVVYGDTDSVFVWVKLNDEQKYLCDNNHGEFIKWLWSYGEEMAKQINDNVNRNGKMRIEMETIYRDFILVGNKNYYAIKYENPNEPNRRAKVIKGLSIKKSNTSKIEAMILSKFFDKLQAKAKPVEIRRMILQEYSDIISGRYDDDVENFVINTRITKSEYDSTQTQAVHIYLAEKDKADGIHLYSTGEQVPYLYVYKKRLYVNQNGLPITRKKTECSESIYYYRIKKDTEQIKINYLEYLTSLGPIGKKLIKYLEKFEIHDSPSIFIDTIAVVLFMRYHKKDVIVVKDRRLNEGKLNRRFTNKDTIKLFVEGRD